MSLLPRKHVGKLIRREQALRKIKYTDTLLVIYQREKDMIDMLIDEALNYPINGNSWQAYEALKKQVRTINLRTDAEYTVLLNFIDYLLPENTTEEEQQRQQEQSQDWTPEEIEYHEQQIDTQLDEWFSRASLIAKQVESQQQIAASTVVPADLEISQQHVSDTTAPGSKEEKINQPTNQEHITKKRTDE